MSSFVEYIGLGVASISISFAAYQAIGLFKPREAETVYGRRRRILSAVTALIFFLISVGILYRYTDLGQYQQLWAGLATAFGLTVASFALGAAGVVFARGEKESKTRVFSLAVARSVLCKKGVFFCLFSFLAVWNIYFTIDPWPFVLLAGICGADLLLITIRQLKGTYGSNDLEAREAARYVIRRMGSGGGPGRFDRVFPEEAAPAEKASTSMLPEAAR